MSDEFLGRIADALERISPPDTLAMTSRKVVRSRGMLNQIDLKLSTILTA